MTQARPGAWWRQARNDLEFAGVATRNGFHTHALPQLMAVLERQGVDGSGLASHPLRALTRMTVTSRYPLEDTPPMDLFDPTDSAQAIATASAVLAWVEQLDQGNG